ncbi:hypothetical protein ACM64Y_01665 [Novispirillum sp. DQ9]|uniref:hypothetical protein n=1 Tax=Novispirillum sp. DQ9 TaxID=3398612 RepID=UPI003C798132
MTEHIELPARVAAKIGADHLPRQSCAEMARTLAALGCSVLPGRTDHQGYYSPIPVPGTGVTRSTWDAASADVAKTTARWKEHPDAPVLIRLHDDMTGYFFHFAYDGESVFSIPESVERAG